MYAIIKTGGKQYRVEENEEIDVELLHKEAGEKVEFSEVLFVQAGEKAHVGQPFVQNFVVQGEVVGFTVGEKISSIKYKPKGHQARRWGHRQKYVRVKITSIASAKKS